MLQSWPPPLQIVPVRQPQTPKPDPVFGFILESQQVRPHRGLFEVRRIAAVSLPSRRAAFSASSRDSNGPTRTRVRSATVEIYDDACAVPVNAFVYYRGVDAQAGALTKYAIDLDAENT